MSFVVSSSAIKDNRVSLKRFFGADSVLKLSAEERNLVRVIEAGLEKVEAGLAQELTFTSSIADSAARYLFEAGGKRVRPSLLLLAAALGDGATEKVIQAGIVVELTHLATLYHDDVMDESELRRGVPTAQHAWGNSVAILTGDLLFAKASQLLVDAEREVLEVQSETFERLVLGQLHETIGPQPGEEAIAHYLQVLADKTGSLISASVQLGALTANVDQQYLAALKTYGEKTGVAFQLVDDVLDLAPVSHKTGKKAGTDLRSGVVTLPLLKLRLLAESDAEAATLLEVLEGAEGGESFERAIHELWQHSVTGETLDLARGWAREAVAALAPLPEGVVKSTLEKFALGIVERNA